MDTNKFEPVRDAQGFLYPLGAVLTHRAWLVEPASNKPQRLFVVERMMVECHGGVQRYYLCRVVEVGREPLQKDNLLIEAVRLTEPELVPLPPPRTPEEKAAERMAEEVEMARLRELRKQAREKTPGVEGA